jgi:hypothetical protein
VNRVHALDQSLRERIQPSHHIRNRRAGHLNLGAETPADSVDRRRSANESDGWWLAVLHFERMHRGSVDQHSAAGVNRDAAVLMLDHLSADEIRELVQCATALVAQIIGRLTAGFRRDNLIVELRDFLRELVHVTNIDVHPLAIVLIRLIELRRKSIECVRDVVSGLAHHALRRAVRRISREITPRRPVRIQRRAQSNIARLAEDRLDLRERGVRRVCRECA